MGSGSLKALTKINNHQGGPTKEEPSAAPGPCKDQLLGGKTIHRRGPLPPRISVTVPPEVALLDVVPTTPIENPTLSGYIFVPPPVPVLVFQGECVYTSCYLTVRGERLIFECARRNPDKTLYVFDMYQYASKCADAGTTVALVHRHSGQCIAASASDGIAELTNFPCWMSQDNEEIAANPRFFLRVKVNQDAEHTLFQCHSGPVSTKRSMHSLQNV
ncbi:uncharacterized protein [Asterias amurensis]|uniref:uncharacterized protein isoform X2 n=1 Tax=Asterias amurensis TaxID=7602 RepID=UPI003AB78017